MLLQSKIDYFVLNVFGSNVQDLNLSFFDRITSKFKTWFDTRKLRLR